MHATTSMCNPLAYVSRLLIRLQAIQSSSVGLCWAGQGPKYWQCGAEKNTEKSVMHKDSKAKEIVALITRKHSALSLGGQKRWMTALQEGHHTQAYSRTIN